MIFSRRADIERACAWLVAAQAPQLPLYRAVADRRIGLLTLHDARNRWPAADLARNNRPLVVLIGDDPGPGLPSLGPLKWKAAERLRRWCRAVVVHAAGGEPQHYAAAVRTAERAGRVGLIETSTDHAAAWCDYLGCPHSLLIVPCNGLPHPVRPEVLQ